MKARAALGVALLVASGLLAASATAGTAQAAKPKINVSYGVDEYQVDATGTVGKGSLRGAPPRKRWRAILLEDSADDGSWAAADSASLVQGKNFALNWSAPDTLASASVRIKIKAGKQSIQSQPEPLTFGGHPGDPKVDAVDPEDVVSLPTASDPTLTLAGIRSFETGQFLTAPPAGNTPDGFLLKVTSSSTSGGQTSVETEPASLYEAVPTGQIAVDLGDLGSAEPLNADARVFSKSMRQGDDSTANVPFSEQVSCTGSGQMSLSGNLDASLEPDLDLDWSERFGIPPVEIDLARATVDASLAADAQASISGAASCELSKLTLFEPRWIVVVPVGPVPVPIEVAIPINVSASAEASGSISVSADAYVGGSVGIQYQDGDVSGINEFSHGSDVTHEVEADASAEARIGPDISVKAGWGVPVLGELAATAALDVYSGLRLTYMINRNPKGLLCVPIHAEGRLVFSIPLVDDITVGPQTIIDEDIVCVEFPPGQIMWSGTFAANFDAQDTEPNLPDERETGDWQYAVDGTTPDGLTPEDGFLAVPASSAWTWEQSEYYPDICSTVTLHEEGANPDSGVHLRLVQDGFQIYGGGGQGQFTSSYHDCGGGSGSGEPEDGTGYGNGALGCFPEFETQPKPAAVDGVLTLSGTLSGDASCFPRPQTGTSERTWNLDVSCVDGGVPNDAWKC